MTWIDASLWLESYESTHGVPARRLVADARPFQADNTRRRACTVCGREFSERSNNKTCRTCQRHQAAERGQA